MITLRSELVEWRDAIECTNVQVPLFPFLFHVSRFVCSFFLFRVCVCALISFLLNEVRQCKAAAYVQFYTIDKNKRPDSESRYQWSLIELVPVSYT